MNLNKVLLNVVVAAVVSAVTAAGTTYLVFRYATPYGKAQSASGQPIAPDQARESAGSVLLYRPSDASADRTVPLTFDSNGRQQLSLEGLAAGRWIVQVTWTREGRTFYRELEVMAR